MNVSDAVQFLQQVLTYVLPAAFLWAITDKCVKAIIRAATGKKGAGVD